MFTVTLIGPDGVGKTTIAKEIEASFPLPIKYIYMGINSESSNYMLPTTRWWDNRKRKAKTLAVSVEEKLEGPQLVLNVISHHESSEGIHRKFAWIKTPLQDLGVIDACQIVAKRIRKALGFANRILEEWYRQYIAYSYLKRGYVIIFDRHFVYDYYQYDTQQDKRSIKQKIHGFLLKHTLPEPDLVICLDAPGEVVYNRKGEFTPEILELKRKQYLSLKTVIKNYHVVDANRKLESVIGDVSNLIYQFHSDTYRNAQEKHT